MCVERIFEAYHTEKKVNIEPYKLQKTKNFKTWLQVKKGEGRRRWTNKEGMREIWNNFSEEQNKVKGHGGKHVEGVGGGSGEEEKGIKSGREEVSGQRVVVSGRGRGREGEEE